MDEIDQLIERLAKERQEIDNAVARFRKSRRPRRARCPLCSSAALALDEEEASEELRRLFPRLILDDDSQWQWP